MYSSSTVVDESIAHDHQVTPASWVPNTPKCQICLSLFGYMWNRPHHCRLCGGCVCHKCSPSTVNMCGSPVRVCTPCATEAGVVIDETAQPGLLDNALQMILAWVISGVSLLNLSQSCRERCARYIRDYNSDVNAAIEAAITKNHSFYAKVTRATIGCLPFVGIPPALIMPIWRQLREVALIAALNGHDVEEPEVQRRILACLTLDYSAFPVCPITTVVATRAIGCQAAPIVKTVVTKQAAANMSENIVKYASEKAASEGLTTVGTAVGGGTGGYLALKLSEYTGAGALVGRITGTAVNSAVKSEVGHNLILTAAKHSTGAQQAASVGTRAATGMLGVTIGIPVALLIDYLTDKSMEIFECAKTVFAAQ